MSLADMFSKPKTYEMPAGASCQIDILKRIVDIEPFETHFKYFDLTVTAEGADYVLHHMNQALFGWSIELNTPQSQKVDLVVKALLSIMGGRLETKSTQAGQVKTTINPLGKVSLRKLSDYINNYPTKGLREPKIIGYRIENLPGSLYKKATQAGLPLQEVKST